MPAEPSASREGFAANGSRWPARLRRLVLVTSVPPLAWVYRGWYGLAAALVVRRLRSHRCVVAIYLRGGGGRGDLVPLVSDLDFVVVVRGAAAEDVRRLREAYGAVARLTRVLDRSPAIHEEADLQRLATVGRLQYWIAEGKATWKLLHGLDVVAGLPDLDAADIQIGLVHETRVWWSRFDACAIQDTRRRLEPVALNSISYKAVSEILGLTAGLEGRGVTFSRSDSLELAAAHHGGAVRDLCRRLQRVRRRRFLGDEPELVEAAKDELAARLDATGRLLAGHELGRELGRRQRVDAPLEEWRVPAGMHAHVERLWRAAAETWGSRFLGASVATGACFDLDEWALGLRVDRSGIPSLPGLRLLHDLHAAAPVEVQADVHPYLLLEHAALQLDADEHTKSERAVLFPAAHPDVFELFCRPEMTLAGDPPPRLAIPAWTPLAADLLASRTELFLDLLGRPQLYGAEPAGFGSFFRKALQLVLIGRSVERGEVLTPLTGPALVRALEREEIEVPPELAPAVAADRGKQQAAPDPVRLASRALAFLTELRGAATPAGRAGGP